MTYTKEERRSKVPADLRRRVLVEAGHRCAIPTCRHIEVEIHHIVPWAQCHEHKYDNLIALCPNCHNRADRGEIDRQCLKMYKSNLRFVHDKFSQLEIDVLFAANELTADDEPLDWPPHSHLLIKRILDAGYVKLDNSHIWAIFNGKQVEPSRLILTEKGREFLKDIESRDM